MRLSAGQSTLEGNFNERKSASIESNPIVSDNVHQDPSGSSNSVPRQGAATEAAQSNSADGTSHMVGAYSTGGRLPVRNYGQQQQEQESTRDPYHQQQQGVVKLEIFFYKVIPCICIIAGSLYAVDLFYERAEFSACAPGDLNCVVSSNDAYSSIRVHEQKYVVSGAFAGLSSSLVVIYQYLARPHLRVYPNPLLVRQTLADLMLACVVIALYSPHNSGYLGYVKVVLTNVIGGSLSLLLLYLREFQWFISLILFIMGLVWLYTRGGTIDPFNETAAASCLVPSTVVLLGLHMSLWRLPLISIDLYRTMTNPFLDFSKAVLQYDFILYVYLFVVGLTFVLITEFDPSTRSASSFISSDTNEEVYCPVLRNDGKYTECDGMDGAWIFGIEYNSTSRPKICLVPGRDLNSSIGQEWGMYLYSIVWVYLGTLASTITTMVMAYIAYRRLVSGTSESIITRLRIIVTNFRNIMLQLSWLVGVFILTSLTFVQPESPLWPPVLVFWIFSRGFMDLVCWFWVNDDYSRRHKTRNGFCRRVSHTPAASADINVNKSLQKEMTSYLGRGLRRSSQLVDFSDPEISKGWRTIQLSNPNEDPNSLRLDFWRFSRLILGMNQNDSTAASSSTVSLDKIRHTATKDESGEEGSVDDDSSHMNRSGSDLGLGFLQRSFYADPTRFFGRKPGGANDVDVSSAHSTASDLEGGGDGTSSPATNAKRDWSDQGPFLMEYSPVTFKAVRDTYGVSEASFRDAWQQDGLELKVNEGGASQAFFFFSADKRFIVKSCTLSEMTLLRNMAMEYAEHLSRYPESFLVRIYGAYNLVVYGTHFRFFVMENLFYVRPPKTSLSIYERYDIKGSWVARNFSPPTAGQQTYCRLCGQKYVVGKKKDKCSAHAQGLHAPNVILKDCDLSSKFQIEPDRAYRISLQLERDSKFLMLRNIMDYSLLVGISYKKVPVTWHSMDSTYESSEGEWAALLSMTEAERMEAATDQADAAYRAVLDNSTSSAPYDSVESSRAAGSSTRNASSDSRLQSGDRNGSSGIYGHRGGIRVMSQAVQQINLGKEPTTQGQDCCIEASSIVGPNAYYFGMIDILQEWTWKKRLERFFKTYFLAKDPLGLSAIDPNTYQDRFMQRIGDIMNLTEESMNASSQRFRSSRSGSVPLDESVVLMPPGLDHYDDDGDDDDDEEAAVLLPITTSVSEGGPTKRTSLTREELRIKQTEETQDDVSPPWNRTAARNAHAAFINEASRASIDQSNSRSSASGSLGRTSRSSKGRGSSIVSNRASYNRASSGLGLAPLQEKEGDESEIALSGLNITDL